MNNNNNNNKKFLMFKNGKPKRSKYKRHKSYRYTIRSAIVNYVTPEYELQNLKFDLYAILTATQTFTSLAKNYLQYRLIRVTFFGMPRVVDGTDPAPVWIYLDLNGQTANFNYVDMPELQGSKTLPVKRFSMTSYQSTGRQNDFKYWYDISEYNPTLAIRLHCEAPPDNNKYWQFQIGFVVDFRGFTIETSNRKFLSKDIKFISSESQKQNQEQELTEEEEKELWEHQDSDWDDEDEEHKVEVSTGLEPISKSTQ